MRVLVSPQVLIPPLLFGGRQRCDVHRLADLTDVPSCQVRESQRLPLITLAAGHSSVPVQGWRGVARPSFLLAETARSECAPSMRAVKDNLATPLFKR